MSTPESSDGTADQSDAATSGFDDDCPWDDPPALTPEQEAAREASELKRDEEWEAQDRIEHPEHWTEEALDEAADRAQAAYEDNHYDRDRWEDKRR